MKFKLLSIFKKIPKINGLISQYHLEDWWLGSFSENERDEILIALKNSVDFGVGISQNDDTNVNDEYNIFTNTKEDSVSLEITPIMLLSKPLFGLQANLKLYEKYIDSIYSLIPRYFSNDFRLDDEVCKVIPEEYQNQVFESINNGTKNVFEQIEHFFTGTIRIYYNLKKDEYYFNKCLFYCEKYIQHIDIFYEARKNIRESLHKVLNSVDIDIEHENKLLSSTALDRYVMLLQHLERYEEALSIIKYIQSIGWKNDWKKRIEILNKKIEKANSQKNK